MPPQPYSAAWKTRMSSTKLQGETSHLEFAGAVPLDDGLGRCSQRRPGIAGRSFRIEPGLLEQILVVIKLDGVLPERMRARFCPGTCTGQAGAARYRLWRCASTPPDRPQSARPSRRNPGCSCAHRSGVTPPESAVKGTSDERNGAAIAVMVDVGSSSAVSQGSEIGAALLLSRRLR